MASVLHYGGEKEPDSTVAHALINNMWSRKGVSVCSTQQCSHSQFIDYITYFQVKLTKTIIVHECPRHLGS